ncbi:hypothetical protein CU098_013177 [Rhizopus stolonifer]|uniref:Uncharacterized protein n=1 Tax=Rhizopus stolonifer TaxID=4846 RepID=A0A367KVI1_RHIST|nr:hypothetical protein CU098_013177 [Rhizopus stolonifer]
MDRMKERHRQEARRSSSSPFMDRNLSSPSMSIIAGATTDRFSHIADGSKNRPQKNMVQSQSCNMFMKPSMTIKNENCSFDIFNAPIQTQSDVSLSNTRRFHSLQHSYHQSALSSLPIQENEEDIPSLPRFALNRSMQQQQIQQQIELKQHQLEEQQRLQQQKLQQLHLQQKQQQEQNHINQAILDSIMSSSLEYEAGKHHLTSKPFCKSIALHRCRTPPPESHHLAIDESKNKKEVLERPLSPVSLTDKEKLASIEDIIMNSSSSTLASDPKIKVVDIPLKLKRELQDMQLRRSSYSVPDLSRFSKENIPEIDENKWNTLCPISIDVDQNAAIIVIVIRQSNLAVTLSKIHNLPAQWFLKSMI